MAESSGTMIKLNSSNYAIWKSMMEDLLYCKDLYLPLGGDTAKPQDKSDVDGRYRIERLLVTSDSGLIRVCIIM